MTPKDIMDGLTLIMRLAICIPIGIMVHASWVGRDKDDGVRSIRQCFLLFSSSFFVCNALGVVGRTFQLLDLSTNSQGFSVFLLFNTILIFILATAAVLAIRKIL